MKRTIEEMKRRLTEQHEQSLARIEKFRDELAKNSGHALKWSIGAFEASGFLSHTHQMVEIFKKHDLTEEQVGYMVNSLRERIRHGAMYPPSSTSVPANLLEQYELSAAVSLLEDVFGESITNR